MRNYFRFGIRTAVIWNNWNLLLLLSVFEKVDASYFAIFFIEDGFHLLAGFWSAESGRGAFENWLGSKTLTWNRSWGLSSSCHSCLWPVACLKVWRSSNSRNRTFQYSYLDLSEQFLTVDRWICILIHERFAVQNRIHRRYPGLALALLRLYYSFFIFTHSAQVIWLISFLLIEFEK